MSQEPLSMQALWDASLLDGGNAAYLEALYEQYLQDAHSVDPHWRAYFDKFPSVAATEVAHSPIQAVFLEHAKNKARLAPSMGAADLPHERQQVNVLTLIDTYRRRGHQKADLDPVRLKARPQVADLTLAAHQLSDADLKTTFHTGSLPGSEHAPLAEIIARLEKIYCHTIGSEYMHITNSEERDWIGQRLESGLTNLSFSDAQKQRIFNLLNKAEGLEHYLHNKYVGQKRFSLEGGESLIPCLDGLIQGAGEAQVKEIVIGMAHRGRLNVLVNVLGKAPKDLFEEFEGKAPVELSAGDVKYHQGFSSDVQTAGGVVHLALAFNPSHLEIVSPVVEGSVRARQERRQDSQHQQVLPIVMHGDAAFAGQGVVMETFSMSQARGFKTGGSVHIVINNQVGFTTSNPLDTRSTLYCTDVAKMVQAPIFHVNADDPEAVMFVTQLALDYRMRFNKDVVIDLVCYRRHGHNEADEPAATQPMMYQKIRAHQSTAKLYAQQLVQAGVLSEQAIKTIETDYRDHLDTGKHIVENLVHDDNSEFAVDWTPFLNQDSVQTVDTRIDEATLVDLAGRLNALPENFTLQKQVGKVMADRQKMAKGDVLLDWGCAENLAYASLLHQGYSIRLTGQDSGRGTFAHRHAVLHEQSTGESFIPLQHLQAEQPKFTVIDSLLSEEAVMAFEYGYATTEPNTLVLWEAQFGDFANGAQVVMDQFISSGEHKWGRLNGLVLLLPHGYEGMGPEHSSARLERYLQLCAEHNMLVSTPTTPAQVFHMLRRQMLAPYRKPLVVMTPKSLLRHKQAVSTLAELAQGEFQLLIDEIDEINKNAVKRVVVCGGKVYYDLLAKRRSAQRKDVAIVRVEQLYPFPEDALKACLAQYPQAKEVVWCQEEPKNQGAWYCTRHHLQASLNTGQKLGYAGRPASASPAAGYYHMHVAEQTKLLEQALA